MNMMVKRRGILNAICCRYVGVWSSLTKWVTFWVCDSWQGVYVTRKLYTWIFMGIVSVIILIFIGVHLSAFHHTNKAHFVANWTMMVGDEIMRDTFMTIANLAIEDESYGLDANQEDDAVSSFLYDLTRDGGA